MSCTLCEKTTGSSRWLCQTEWFCFLLVCPQWGISGSLGSYLQIWDKEETELVHFVLKMLFSQVIWHIGLVFWEVTKYLVTNPVTLACRWEWRTEYITKLESSEDPLPLLEGRRGVPILLPLYFTGKLLLQAALAVILSLSCLVMLSICWILLVNSLF